MEIYARDWIKNKKYVTELQTLTNIGRWGKGRGENIAISLTLISTSHIDVF